LYCDHRTGFNTYFKAHSQRGLYDSTIVTAEHPGTMDKGDDRMPPLRKVTAEFATNQAGRAGHQYSQGRAVPCRAHQTLMT
jgi:hypothetical protein